MAVNPEITENVRQVRNATYGKDVREAIARGLEICYGFTSGETAMEAADRANAAAEVVEAITDESREALDDLEEAVRDIDSIVKISSTQPVEEVNKIWVQSQDQTEYKIATYSAYEELWSRMNAFDNLYGNGHGGISSIVRDNDYYDPENELSKRYVVTYSDTTTSEFFVNDGARGPIGPIDQIEDTTIYYHKGIINNGELVPTPPEIGDEWTTSLPNMASGEYLWTLTRISYVSGAQAYIYGLTRYGVDGSGAVNSVKLGADGTAMVGDIVLPVDSTPTENSSNIVYSGGVYTAFEELNDSIQNELSVMRPRQISVTMSTTSYEYLNSSITENTHCLIEGINASRMQGTITWTTTQGRLQLTASSAPSASTTFRVILFEVS